MPFKCVFVGWAKKADRSVVLINTLSSFLGNKSEKLAAVHLEMAGCTAHLT